MSQDSNEYYLGGHGHRPRRRGDHRSRSDSRHHPSQPMEVDPSWSQSLQSPASSYQEPYPSHHATTDPATPRHRPELPQYSQPYASSRSNASNFTYQPTFQEGYGGSASSFTHQPTYQEDYGGSASNYTHQPTYQEGYGSSASNYIHEPTHRERYGSSASNYIPTHREGYGSSASNYIHEPTHQEGYGSYATDHGIPATNPRHQSSRTGRSEPQELDSNQGYETTPGQSQYRQRRNRNPISPAFDEDIRSSISTPPRGGSRSTDHPLAPPVPQPSMRRIRGGTSAESTLDPNYQVQGDPTDFFKPGRVFSTLWHESEGSTYSNRTLVSDGPIFVGKYGERIHSQIRRMVVYKRNGHCSWCFPIYTYNGKGVAKRGVNVLDHAVIYTQGADPRPDPREPRMTKRPLEFVPSTPDQVLDSMSRLNFGKIYTVEHNVKVRKAGHISPNSMATFTNYARSSLLGE